MEEIRIGIIGHGFMGHEHEKMLTEMEGFRVVGIADTDPKQLEDVKEGLKRYSSNEVVRAPLVPGRQSGERISGRICP